MTGSKHPSIESHIIFTGVVQGVCFRAKTKNHAERLCLNGYVQNLSDRSVEICIEGEEIEPLIEALRKEPLPVQIDTIQVSKRPLAQRYKNFIIKSRA